MCSYLRQNKNDAVERNEEESLPMIYRKLIIDGNAVYEIDEECMRERRRQLEEMERREKAKNQGDRPH